ncbi:MAG: MMPL family transporter [Pseudomonadales bacterium]|nr:MMPL family transporter [Pseudomonadales bacterium]
MSKALNNNWRTRIDDRFFNFSNLIYDNKFKVLLGILAIIAALVIHLPKITIDTSTEGFLYKNDPKILAYNDFRNQFGRDERIIIAIKTDDVFAPDFLKTLFALHSEIEQKAPYIKEVNSLKNARKTTGNEQELVVEDLFEGGIPDDAKALETIKQFTLSNPIYKNLYLNEDATFTTIIITTQTYTSIGENPESESDLLEDGFDRDLSFGDTGFDESGFDGENTANAHDERQFINVLETNQLVASIEEILKKYQNDEMKIYVAGSPIVTKNLQASLISDMSIFILYVIITIALLLLIMFKRVSGILLPLFVVILTLLSTVGSMALSHIPITAMMQVLPSLLLAVGVGASVHLLAIFYKKYDETHDKKAALAYALSHSGLAIFMTSLTTAASLAAFSFSDLAPVARLGIFAALGVGYQLILTLVFLPALISFLPIKPKQKLSNEKPMLLDKLVHSLGVLSITYPKTIVIIAGGIIVISFALASTMQFSHNPLHWFPADNEVRINTETIDKELKGSITIEVVLDTQKENGVYDPHFLNTIEEVSNKIYTFRGEHYFIGKIISINDVIKEINRALNENRQSEYRIPQDRNLIAQEFLLFENSGSDDLENIVDSRFSKTRLSIKAPWVDSVEYVALMEDLEVLLEDAFKDTAKITITGTLPILADTITKTIRGNIESYIIAFGVIALLMILLLGSVKMGLLSMIPNLTPIMIGVAVMVVLDMPLDMFTILIGAIAIGMVVDDTIHFMHNFSRYLSQTNNVDEAILLTINSTGRAIFITSIVLSSGFFVFMFASMTNLYNFGLITGTVVLVAMAADLILIGALMKLVIKPQKKEE